MPHRLLIIACGALARELHELARLSRWDHVDITCLSAELHNRPQEIVKAVREKTVRNRMHYSAIFAAYADCGTGGRLDRVLAEFGVERLPGVHCYELLAGAPAFDRLSSDEPGTFYVTDFLVRHFDRLVYRGLGLDRFPQLMSAYFGNYRKLLYLAQREDDALKSRARDQAARLGLAFEYHFTGLDSLRRQMEHVVAPAARKAGPLDTWTG